MPKRLSVVFALPVGSNPGMLSVEQGFEAFRRRHALDCEIAAYSFETGSEGADRASLEANWDEALAADCILYWGDFQQSRRFLLTDLLARKHRRVREDLLERSYRHLLLQGAEDAVLERTILFGGSLLSDDVSDACDPSYAAAATRLFSRAREVWMRDPVSVSLASALAGHARPIRLGVDGALLREPVGAPPAARAARSGKPVCGWAIARSAQPGRSGLLAERLAERLGAELRALRWLRDPAPLHEKLAAVAACDVVVTDIYHLAVNSWREGVPAICIGAGAETRAGTLSDKKKELFYAACGARPFYVFLERLRGQTGPAAEAERAIQVLARPELAQAVIGRLRSQARAIEAELAAALKGVLRTRLRFRMLARR